MSLFTQLQNDLKQAMKDRDSETLEVLRLLVSSLKNLAIETKQELTDADVLAAVKRDLKKLQDALNDFTKAARADLVEKAEKEIAIVKKYLPPELTDEELRAKIDEVLKSDNIDAKDIGKIMGLVMKEIAGQADGNRVRTMVQSIVNEINK
jgi:uncharacterized protein YqeY